MQPIDEINIYRMDEEIQDEANEQVDVLLDQIKLLKNEIKIREESITSLCKRYKIDAVLDC